MRALQFALSLLLVAGSAQASDDRPLTTDERGFHLKCLDRAWRLDQREMNRYELAVVRGLIISNDKALSENRNGYLPKYRGRACNTFWDKKIAHFAERRASGEMSDHDFAMQQKQQEMEWIDTTREKLLAMSSTHKIVTGNGYRIDHYTIDGRPEHCTTQVYSQGPIMKCSRWPD